MPENHSKAEKPPTSGQPLPIGRGDDDWGQGYWGIVCWVDYRVGNGGQLGAGGLSVGINLCQ